MKQLHFTASQVTVINKALTEYIESWDDAKDMRPPEDLVVAQQTRDVIRELYPLFVHDEEPDVGIPSSAMQELRNGPKDA